MSMRTLLAAATAALVLAAPGQARAGETAASCAAPPPRTSVADAPIGLTATEIRWTKVTRRTTYGNDAVLQGQVVTSDGAVPGAEVHLWERPAGGAWSFRSSTTSDTDSGVFAFCGVLPERTTVYRVEYHGDVLHSASRAARTVQVARRVDDTMHRSGASTFAHAGRVSPSYRGVVLQQHRSGSGPWRTVRRHLADGSQWSFRLRTAGLAGEHSWRAVVPAGGGYARGTGGVWRITFR